MLVAEDDVMSIDVITGVFEKGVSVRTGIECNLFDELWNEIAMPSTEIDVFWIRHELIGRGDGRINNAGAVDFWENNLDVIAADEITPTFETEFEVSGISSLLALGFEKSPWERDGGSAGHVKWASPDIVDLLGIEPAESDGLWELSWNLNLGESRNSGDERNWVVDEAGETIDGLASDSLDVGNDEIIERKVAIAGTNCNICV
jgi:hypothetical protein